MKREVLLLIAGAFFATSLAGCESTQESFSLTGDEAAGQTEITYPYDPSELQDSAVGY